MVNAAALGRHIGMSRQAVGQLADRGVLPSSSGQFDLDGCRIAYIRWLRDENRKSAKTVSASRVQDARAREIEIRIAREDGTIITRADHREIFSVAFGGLKARFASVPARVTRDLDLRNAIEHELDEGFRDCARRFAQARSSGTNPSAVTLDQHPEEPS